MRAFKFTLRNICAKARPPSSPPSRNRPSPEKHLKFTAMCTVLCIRRVGKCDSAWGIRNSQELEAGVTYRDLTSGRGGARVEPAYPRRSQLSPIAGSALQGPQPPISNGPSGHGARNFHCWRLVENVNQLYRPGHARSLLSGHMQGRRAIPAPQRTRRCSLFGPASGPLGCLAGFCTRGPSASLP